MFLDGTGLPMQYTVEAFIPPTPLRSYGHSNESQISALRVILLEVAILLQRLLPLAQPLMPEMAAMIICVAAGLSALADRIA